MNSLKWFLAAVFSVLVLSGCIWEQKWEDSDELEYLYTINIHNPDSNVVDSAIIQIKLNDVVRHHFFYEEDTVLTGQIKVGFRAEKEDLIDLSYKLLSDGVVVFEYNHQFDADIEQDSVIAHENVSGYVLELRVVHRL